MIDGEEAIHLQQASIGQRRTMFVGRAALGFELIAEIADVSTGELKRQWRSVDLNILQRTIQLGENIAAQDFASGAHE